MKSLVKIVLCFCAFCTVGVASEKYALLYNGAAADSDCLKSISSIIGGLGVEVRYIQNLDDLSLLLPGAALFSIGGTDDDLSPIQAACSPQVVSTLNQWIREGGSYLGICGGAYLGATGWNGDTQFYKALNVIPSVSDSYLENDRPVVLPITWDGQRIPMYYQLGPMFTLPSEQNANVSVLARYSTGAIAALFYSNGKGKSYLIGPHPEADSSWLDSGVKRSHKWVDSRPIIQKILRSLLKK